MAIEKCLLCDNALQPGNGDNWDGLCPSCADAVSNYLDRHKLSDDHRDDAIAVLKALNSTPLAVQAVAVANTLPTLFVKTYNGEAVTGDEFIGPDTPISLVPTPAGLRVVLGVDLQDQDDDTAPDVWIERQAGGKWHVAIHTDAGDPAVLVVMHDHGNVEVKDRRGNLAHTAAT